MTAFKTTDAIGIREDLSDVIHQISPETTPFQSNIGRETCSNTFYEWQVDELAQVDLDNNVAEGADVSAFEEIVPTVRNGNFTQISRKEIKIANTLESVTKAGRRSEVAYQLAKKSAELKRDIEAIALSNQAGVSGVTRKTAAILSWLRTNTSLGDDGADPAAPTNGTPLAGRTHGTQRDFTEAMLQDVVQQCFREGANPRILMVGPSNKQSVSAFTGIAAQRYNATGAKPSTIIAAADVYVNSGVAA